MYGTLDDEKLDSSIRRAILKLEKKGMTAGQTYETRHYSVTYRSSTPAMSWQDDGERLYFVVDKRTEKKYRARHCFTSGLYSGSGKNNWYWVISDESPKGVVDE